jgi:hypothetical protein
VSDASFRPAKATSSRPRRLGWLLAFLGFFLIIGAWATAAPYDGTPDEQHHIIRAAGVASGQVMAAPEEHAVRDGGAYQDVPASLIRRPNCFAFHPDQSATCSVEPGGDRTVTHVGTAAGRYHPGYYAIVGWPLALWPDWTGILLARLISAALCAALLANALTDAMRWSRFRLMGAGVLAAFTPIAAQMGGAVNPNGVEIAAGIAFFAAAIPLLFTPAAERSRTLLWHVGVAAFALASLRSAGPVWLAVSAVALLIPVPWQRLRRLWQWRPVRWWVLAVGLAAGACAAWTVIFKTNFAGDIQVGHRSIGQAIRVIGEYWGRYTDELVGVTAWLDVHLPPPVYLIWQFMTASLIIWGLVLANRTGRLRLLAIGLGGVLLPSLMQLSYINTYGLIMQGRYILPVLAGLPLLAAYLIQQSGLPPEKSRFVLRLFALLLLPLHLVALAYTMVRWQHGLVPKGGFGSLNPLAGPWHPPLGSVVPLVASLVGLLAVGWLVWSSRYPASPTLDDTEPAGEPERVIAPAPSDEERETPVAVPELVHTVRAQRDGQAGVPQHTP